MNTACVACPRARATARRGFLPLGLASTLAAAALVGCDQPPDIHVHVTSEMTGPADYAVWRMWAGRRLNPRVVGPAHAREFGGQGWGGEPEPPTELRVEPLGPLPGNEWVLVRVDRYEPAYRPNRPVARAFVLTRFRAAEHLRLDLRMLRPRDRPRSDSGVFCSGVPECNVALPAPGCRAATPEDLQRVMGPMGMRGSVLPGGRTLTCADVEPDDGCTEAEGFSAPPPVPAACVFVCEHLPGVDAPPPRYPSFTDEPRPGSTAPDAAPRDASAPGTPLANVSTAPPAGVGAVAGLADAARDADATPPP